MAKIMLVGLGGTGSKIVVEVENLINHLPEESRKNIAVATLGIDTHDQYLSEIGDPVSSLQISTDAVTLIKNIDHFPYIKSFWNPEITPKDTSNGAGGIRILSRLSVFRHGDKIYERVGNAMDKLAAIKGEGDIYVFVVGSLYGGTGSGAFLDVANIIANKLQENLSPTDFRIIGHFFLPSILPARTDRNMENTYASLSEYEYILKSKKYIVSYNQSMQDFESYNPYQNFFLISGFTHNNLTLPHKPEDFYNMVAHKLYYEIISQTLFREFMGKLIDIHVLGEEFEYTGGIRKPTAFSSFGISVVGYPYDNIRRYFTYKIAGKLMSSGFLNIFDREEINNDVRDFINSQQLDKLDRTIRQDKQTVYDAEELRFKRADYDRPGTPLEQIRDQLYDDYQIMKTTGFDRFYKTVEKKTGELEKEFKKAFITKLKALIKNYGLVRAIYFVEILMQDLYQLEKKYHEQFLKFEKISDDAALELVEKELNDVRIKVKVWWPLWKRQNVMTEVDEFIEEANKYIEDNMSEIINEYSARIVADIRQFIVLYYQSPEKQGPAGGFLERLKSQCEYIRSEYERIYKEISTYIQGDTGKSTEYRVVQNLLPLSQLEEIFNKNEINYPQYFTLLTNEYMPDLLLDPERTANMEQNLQQKELDRFNTEQLNQELSNKLLQFSYNIFDDCCSNLKVENIINSLGEEEIISKIDEMIKYCSPFLAYKRDVAQINRIENTMLLINTSAYSRVKNRIRNKYGQNYFFLETDDVDFLMIMKYVHGYDLNSLTEIEAIARKYKALREDEKRKRHIDLNFHSKLEPLLVQDIKVISDDSYFYFAVGLFSSLGKDFPLEFGVGMDKVNPKFEGRSAIDRTETGINFRFLDWEGKSKEELELGRTLIEAFNSFEKQTEILDSLKRYEKKYIDRDSKGYKTVLESGWKQFQDSIEKLKSSTRQDRDQEISLFKKMSVSIDKRLSEMQ